jgi:hypothetical protein
MKAMVCAAIFAAATSALAKAARQTDTTALGKESEHA